ncbi:uncharacterized protein LOC3289647 isoform X1 [Anopheles gambiae]|uniref:Importin N-terminal domain-containing protein n=1 Tax=Anopheles coluzzii TaxID=1518534 RepID=A0A6E8V8C3_ANOCL|nr:uncharacterized protein LOC120954826 isoform X1 [Anopheles coluzzii]XP_061513482.1 uncharacterized protein LOC3289647 isoform X1 [Anopheles gambiae]XP_566117.5 uncharacterized protein LOC3289647 isoform X1 [Anopheles gambiae]
MQQQQPSPSMLVELEALLDRLYQGQVSNEEKQRIEQQLRQYRRTSFNWRYCLEHLDTFRNNQYLWYFAASTIEEMIRGTATWKQLDQSERQQVLHGLMRVMRSYPADVPPLQRDKVAHMLVQVVQKTGSSDPANSYGTFVEVTVELLRDKFQLGLALCRAIGENVGRSASAPEDFTETVQRHAPRIMHEVNRCCGLFAMMATGSPTGTPLDALPPDCKHRYCIQLMELVHQYFTWMRLDQLDAALIGNVAMLACAGDPKMTDAATGSVSALTELLHRNECMGVEPGRRLAEAIFSILVHVTQNSTDDFYQLRVCDLLRQYMKRGWPHGDLLLARGDEVLMMLFRFTVDCAKTELALYLADRVSLWKYVLSEPRIQLNPLLAQQLLGFMHSTLFLRNFPIFEQFHTNDLDANCLEMNLDHYHNQCYDLIIQLAQLLAPNQLQELMQSVLLSNGGHADKGGNPYIDCVQLFRAMVEALRGNGLALGQYSENQIRLCMVDYVAASRLAVELTRAVYSRLAPVDEYVHEATVAHIQLLVELSGLLQPLLQLCKRMRHAKSIFSALTQLILETMHYMQLGPASNVHVAGLGLIERRISPIVTSEMLHAIVTELPRYLVDYQLPAADAGRWMEMVRAALELLDLFLSKALLGPRTSTLVLEQLSKCGGLAKLPHLDRATRGKAYWVVCGCLLQAEQEMMREQGAIATASNNNNNNNPTNGLPSAMLNQYVGTIARGLVEFQPNQWAQSPGDGQNQMVRVLVGELRDLTDLLAYFETHSSSTMRNRLAHAMARPIEQMLAIFRGTSGSLMVAIDATGVELVDSLLDFCNQAVSALQSKLDMRQLQQVIDTLHQLFTAEERYGKYRLRSANTLLGMFRKLVPDPRNQSLMPVIVQVVLQQMLPAMADDTRFNRVEDSFTYEDVLVELYSLLNDLLHHRWQYFVVSNLMMSGEPDMRTILQTESFLAIMNAYGYVLTSHTHYPRVVRYVLKSLVMLDERRNLFRLPFFVERLMDDFIRSLLELALSNTGSLLLEQIAKTLYGISRVDPLRIRVVMFGLNLPTDTTTFNMLQAADDPPSFQAVIERMVKEANARASEL